MRLAPTVCLLSTPTVIEEGRSTGNYANFNMAAHTGDDWQNVSANRQLLVDKFALPSHPHWLKQTHSDSCVEFNKPANVLINNQQQLINADASITRQPGVVCAILTADCLPIFASDKHGSVVGVCHAGWRGILAGVVENFIVSMAVNPADINVYFGAAIGVDAFAVGDEVLALFVAKNKAYSQAFVRKKGCLYLDIYHLVRLILNQLKVVHSGGGNLCTVQGNYFSHRRQGELCGRNAHLIWFT